MAAYQCLNCEEIERYEDGVSVVCCDKQDLFCINRMPSEILELRKQLAAAPQAAHSAEGVSAQAFKTKVYQALGIGSACDEHVVFVNIENLIRRELCLSAIEREFFMVETPPDEGEGDTEPGEECLLNWGSTPEQYVKQFAEALAATHPTQQGPDAGSFEQSMSDLAQEDAQDAARWRHTLEHRLCLSPKSRRSDIEVCASIDIEVCASIDIAIAAQAKQGGAA